jgi:hypothetical protein
MGVPDLYRSRATCSRRDPSRLSVINATSPIRSLTAGASTVVDRLPNLQLLEGAENFDKRAKLPAEWVRTQYPDPTARAGWLAANDLHDLPEISDFLTFYEARQVRMKDRLTTCSEHSRSRCDHGNLYLRSWFQQPPAGGT